MILKAVKGGGGRGLRVHYLPMILVKHSSSSKNEAVMLAFSSDRIYVEKYLENPRHIEVQVLGDDSKVIQLGERDCSDSAAPSKKVNQKHSSPAVTSDIRAK